MTKENKGLLTAALESIADRIKNHVDVLPILPKK
jgi:hypothetical protein